MALVNEWNVGMIRKIAQFGLLGIIILSFVTSLIAPAVSAQTEPDPAVSACDKRFYSDNDILYYDRCSTANQCTSGQVSTNSTVTIEKTDTIETIYRYLTTTPLRTNGNKPLSAVQAAGVMGNFYAESGFNPSAVEATSRPQKGHGLAQWTFGRWDGPNGLLRFAISQDLPWNDLEVQLDYLKKELEGSEQGVLKDPQFASTNDPATAAIQWRVVFERADPALAHDDKRTGAAVAVYNMFGGAAANCQSVGNAVAGNFMQTAINFALTTYATSGMTKQADARDSYQIAKKQFNPAVDWTDCGGFVATAMIASGVDTKFPKVNVAAQLAYVRDNPDKYIVSEKPTLAQLQPGDILFVDGHVAVYTGAEQFPMVDAALGDHVPSVRGSANLNSMLTDPTLVSARLVK